MPIIETRERYDALVKRLDGLAPAMHIPSEVVGLACDLSVLVRRPLALINHGPNYSLQEKGSILVEYQEDIAEQLGVGKVSVLPLKTLTLQFKHEGVSYILLTRVGDHRLDPSAENDLKPVLKELLQIKRNPLARNFTINPFSDFDPKKRLGIEPGLVSPFVRPGLTDDLKGLLYYRDDSFDGFVAMAVSPGDTLVVHKTVFDLMVGRWQENFPGIPFRAVLKGGDQSVVNK